MFPLTRAGCLEPLQRTFVLSPPLCRLHSTIFDKRVSVHHRGLKIAETTHVRTLLAFLLRPFAGRAHGLPVRDDGSLSIKALLRHPQFTSMSFLQLEQCVMSDVKHRFVLCYDPKQPEDPWWIRAKAWNEKNTVLYPILATDKFNLPVIYTTTLAAWEDHIAAKGIPCGPEGYIHLTLGLPAIDFISPTSPHFSTSPMVHIHVHPIRALVQSNIHFFLVGPKPQDVGSLRTMWTKGDENGIIPSTHFGRVEVVKVQKRVLAGKWEENIATCAEERKEDSEGSKTSNNFPYPIADPHVDPSTGRRRTFVKLPERNVREFADMVAPVGGWKLPVAAHSVEQQRQEARELVFQGA